ncbi:NUDIX domain-containing protein [Listeria sp. FSL L7-1582]|uniref:MutT/nudix family protein n=1 Tax=Listeria cornellensis FSL F6-0969 TaxID=1265820 RepID=W7BRY4_9LIST|nr:MULTISPECIES: NUDIX domain-containing protein [Listeria]EUJ29509.1 MutT/nudix family protein [Listeria cornellensis FSL F6-0969]MBC6309795.1 NUDIX domain-containing protein [Listeria portnoyi]
MKPIFPAVKAVIIHNGQFLVLKKAGVEGDVWELPGGRMNFGETKGEALFREVQEETGLQVQPFILYDTWEFFQPEYQITGVIYLCEKPDGDVRLSSEHQAYEWFPLDASSLERMDVVFASRMVRWDFEAIQGFMS